MISKSCFLTVMKQDLLYPDNLTRRGIMIEITRLNGVRFSINCDLIETVEETPDTVITLTNGKKFVVSENMEQIKNLIIDFKKQIYGNTI